MGSSCFKAKSSSPPPGSKQPLHQSVHQAHPAPPQIRQSNAHQYKPFIGYNPNTVSRAYPHSIQQKPLPRPKTRIFGRKSDLAS